MKGNISLKEFIQDVKQELVAAQDSSNPFYELHEVQLEVSFALKIEGGGKAKFVVVELGADTTASQLHRVTMKFVPLDVQPRSAAKAATDNSVKHSPPGTGGSIKNSPLSKQYWKPVYAPKR